MTIHATDLRDLARILRLLGETPGCPMTPAVIQGEVDLEADDILAHLAALVALELVIRDGREYRVPCGIDVEVRSAYAKLIREVPCRVCGCSDSWACDEGCWWVDTDLCSGCAESIRFASGGPS